jgi:hypothetical protein
LENVEVTLNESSFAGELRRMADSNGIHFIKERQLLEAMREDLAADARFINIFRGSSKQTLLLVTSLRTLSVRSGSFSVKIIWVARHADVRGVRATRRVVRGMVIDALEVETSRGRHEFWFGCFTPDMHVQLEIAEHNADIAVEQVTDALEPAPSGAGSYTSPSVSGGLSFDPDGPEKAGEAGRNAYDRFQWSDAFMLYVKAMDRLHDFYVFEGFRNREPSPKDGWLVDGLISSLGVTRDQDPTFDVRPGVREATHRLRTIASAVEGAGGNPALYRRGLVGLSQYAHDIDVSDMFWN